MNPRVTVVIPALDEVDSLPAVLAEVRTATAQAGRLLDLVLIDDASRDGTQALMQAEPGARVIHHDAPKGCHPSTLEGFAAAQGDWVVFFPADGQVPPGVLTLLLQTAELRGLDVVIGVRARRADSLFRRMLARTYAGLLKLLVDLPYRDVDSSTLYRREVLQAVLPEVRSDSACIAAELLWRIRAKGGRIGEVEIAHRPRTAGRAKGVNWKDALGVPRNLLSLALARRRAAG